MVRIVGIIGFGYVGVILVNNLLVIGSVDKFVLIDINELKVNLDVMDFEDVFVNLFIYIKVVKNNYWELKYVDVVVIVVGLIGV